MGHDGIQQFDAVAEQRYLAWNRGFCVRQQGIAHGHENIGALSQPADGIKLRRQAAHASPADRAMTGA